MSKWQLSREELREFRMLKRKTWLKCNAEERKRVFSLYLKHSQWLVMPKG